MINTSSAVLSLQGRTMIIDDVYFKLKADKFANSHGHYSTRFLGRSSRYYDYLIYSQAEPSLTALVTLAFRITRFAGSFSDPALADQKKKYTDVASQVWDELKRRSETDAWQEKPKAMRFTTQSPYSRSFAGSLSDR